MHCVRARTKISFLKLKLLIHCTDLPSVCHQSESYTLPNSRIIPMKIFPCSVLLRIIKHLRFGVNKWHFSSSNFNETSVLQPSGVQRSQTQKLTKSTAAPQTDTRTDRRNAAVTSSCFHGNSEVRPGEAVIGWRAGSGRTISEGLKGFPWPLMPPEILKPRPGFFSILTHN